MPDSVSFDGIDDKLAITGFPASTATAAMTILAIFRLEAFDTWDTIFGWNSLDGGLQFDSGTPALQLAGDAGGGFAHSQDDTGFKHPTEDMNDWLLMGWGKGVGSPLVPRYHKYSWATGVHAHQPALGGESINNMAALTTLRASENVAFSSQLFRGQLLIAAVWNSLLSDAVVEGLIAGKQAWIDSAPVAAWRFDSATVLNTIVGATTQQSRTGTTLAAGVAPAGWTDGPAGPPPQQVRPDADVTTTGWTTAPLWSKVDEEVASDGDFISSTAV
jgi:hypothetical protein